jgi:uncharacterized alkaline shock family protein YloU
MLYEEKNEKGRVRYGENIIGAIARQVIDETGGRAVPSDIKGRQLRGGALAATDDAIVDAEFKDAIMDATVYVLVRFGSSIGKVCEDIDRGFRKAVPRITGAEVGELTIFVKGLLSKNISKRDIRVTTHAGDQPGN